MLVTLHRAVLLTALTVALVATGFAHSHADRQDETLIFALQNGVSLSDFCGGDPGNPVHPGVACLACHVVGTCDLPPMTGVRIDLGLAFHAAVVAPLEVRAIRHAPDPAHRPQGPPVV